MSIDTSIIIHAKVNELVIRNAPVAKAGPNFQAIIRSGKFHGIICPQTPTGS